MNEATRKRLLKFGERLRAQYDAALKTALENFRESPLPTIEVEE